MIEGIQGSQSSWDLLESQSVFKKHSQPDPEMLFKKTDANGDGKIDREELQNLAAQIEEKTGQKMDVEQMFADYDADEDGSLSRSELDRAMQSQLSRFQGALPGPGPEMMFEETDADGDGSVDEEELKILAARVKEKTGQELDVEEMLKTCDEDQDGSLNPTELENAMKSRMGQMEAPPPAPGNDADSFRSQWFQNQDQNAAHYSFNLVDFQA